MTRLLRSIRSWRGVALLPLLGACNMVVMHPAGDVAMQQRNLILIATGLMLLVIVPVMALTILFAFRYRAANTQATYSPDWDHSTQLELVIWAVPLLIIILLGAVTWTSTHLLDPYRQVGRIAPGRPVAAGTEPLEVEVVALDWKWLFIYPKLGIATVNELAAPVDVPISFKITSTTVMNSFFIPALAGQIYAMPGMETRLHAVANTPGVYAGQASNYNGAGFSDMRFRFHALPRAGFDGWVAQVKASGVALDRARYLRLQQPSEKVPVQHYAGVAPQLYPLILNMCAKPGQTCMAGMMSADRRADGHGAVAGMQGNAAAGNGQRKPTGALFRNGDEKGTAPHWSQERKAVPPPGSQTRQPNRNRDFTTLLPRDVPAATTPVSKA
ncbi:ubiquinol oxidase subunit II [Sphingomonas bacterium]|uniref:ubiquinol oxidase subunit II n=1 Tax=Sphingomonas bacterium TaxID=1895847 RepID=UPI0015759793|nr:ubiquinol oxidase subunit II [Sphingomonas bacterium]